MENTSARLPKLQPWYWIVPRIAIGLFVLAVIVLLWLLHYQEIEEQRASLIGDMLWVEQNLQFSLKGSQEQLQQLAQEYFSEDNKPIGNFLPRIRSFLVNHPGVSYVEVLDAEGRPLRKDPGMIDRTHAGTAIENDPVRQAFHLSRSTGLPTFSASQKIGSEWYFALLVPYFRDDHHVGSLLTMYSFRALLADQVPWWFAQKFRLSVIDANGTILGSKSNTDANETTLFHRIPFDPPGHGLILVASAYKSETSLSRNLLALVIVALGAGVLASLWAQRHHMHKRLQAEQALSKEYAFRKAMEDSLFTGLRARDLDGRIIYVNPAFCRMTGFDASELVNRLPPMPYWAPEEHEATQAAHLRSLSGQAPNEGVELRFQRKNGERFNTLIYEAPLIDAEGRHTGWMGSVVDITERKRAEELVRQQQEKLQFTARLVTMGEMASSLAHEINQPLTAISSYTTGCLNRLEAEDLPREELRDALGKLAHQAQRAGRVIRRIYDFVRRSGPQHDQCDINSIIEDAVGLIEGDARKHGTRISLALAEGLLPVRADRIMLEQVLLNLMRNGIEAMQVTQHGDKQVFVQSVVTEEGIEISVRDRGCGIPEHVVGHLFEPFFSTKPEGMGMGLNICRSIIESHQGRLWFESNPEGGSIFRFTLPTK